VDIRWTDYVGRDLDGFPLAALLGVRDGRAFFLTTQNGEERLLQAAAFDGGQFERWTRATRLSHPHLIEILAAGESALGDEEEAPRVVYAVSPIPDDDLGEQIGRNAFAPETAGRLLTAIASALDYLHGQGLAHRAVTPANVFVVRETIRLAADSIEPASDVERREDLRQLGETLAQAAGTETDERLQPIISGMQSSEPDWTAGRVLQSIAEPLTRPPVRRESPAPVVEMPLARPMPLDRPASAAAKGVWAAIAAVGVVVIGLAIFVGGGGTQEEPQTVAAQADRPSVLADPAAPVPAPPAATEPAPAASTTRTRTVPAQPNWGVIVATYGAYEGAEKRAAGLRERWPQFAPGVYPRAGEGRRYYVVLGSGLTKDEAEDLHQRALQAGMPADAYVTRLGGAQLPEAQ
jgi:hypothetical protein